MAVSACIDHHAPSGATARFGRDPNPAQEPVHAPARAVAGPRRPRALLWVPLLTAAAGLAWWFTPWLAPGGPSQAPAAAALPTVTVSPPLQRRVTPRTVFSGQFSAIDRVELRAQVSGYLTEIHFKDGQRVERGDLLFVIDPRPYEIALEAARAQYAATEAALDLTVKQLARTADLMRSEYASRERLDQRTQEQRGAEAARDRAKAALRSAELNLEWTRVTAPISGRISARRVSVGNLVSGGPSGQATTLLTTIVSLDPLHLDFDMSESDYLAYRRHAAPDGYPRDPVVGIALSDETGFIRMGRLDFLDNEIDRASGTVRVRATVPNGDRFLSPGQFARLSVPTASEADALLVPEASLSSDQSHTLVMTVAADGTVVAKDVEVGAAFGGLRVVTRGLGPEDRVVINGQMFARPGAKVVPQPGRIAEPPGQS